MRFAAILLLTLIVEVSHPVEAPAKDFATTYLEVEADRILAQGDRIKGEATRMRSEGARLNREASSLREGASKLDALWEKANHTAPQKYVDFAGRAKSQQRMRSDAAREDNDAEELRAEGGRLDDEAVRLWKLAAEVNPRAQKDLLDRIRGCCKADQGLEMLRAEIVSIRRSLGSNYVPATGP